MKALLPCPMPVTFAAKSTTHLHKSTKAMSQVGVRGFGETPQMSCTEALAKPFWRNLPKLRFHASGGYTAQMVKNARGRLALKQVSPVTRLRPT